jgi:3-oxoacyl-[acyl-carrier-protein] synthase III
MAFDPPAHPELLEGTDWVINKGGCGPHLTPEFDELYETVLADMIVDGLTNAARKAGLTLADLDMIVVHQAFAGLIDIWTRRLEQHGVPRSKWRSTFDKYGNVGAVDVPITLADLLAGEGIPAGANVALFAPGGGGHTPSVIMRWLG